MQNILHWLWMLDSPMPDGPEDEDDPPPKGGNSG